MIRLLKYFKGYRITALLGPIFKFLEALFELLIPLVVAQIIDKGILAGNKSYCIRMTAFMVLLGFIGFISSLTAQFFAARSATGFAANVRLALFKHIQTLSFSDVDNLGTVTMVTRLTNDISRMQNGVNMALRLLLRSPFIVFGAMIMAFTRDAKAAVVFVIVIVVLFIIVYCIIAITVPFYREIQSRLDRVLNLTRENVNGVRVIRAFCNEENETEKFKTANERLHSLQVATGNIAAFTNPLTYAAINVGIIFLIYVCGIRVNMGYMSAGTTVALYNYMSQILVELIKLANLLITISGAMACANRIADVMDIKPGMESGSAKLSELYSEKTDTPVVEFVNASVSYGGEGNGALNDVNFKIYPGETVGVIGGTGSGKSTLAGLIPRFYDVSKGSVKVMGKDVRELDTEELRKNIGIVMQKAVLFKGNIKSNLEFSEPRARNEEMRAALEMAQIGELDIEHEITQGGNNLSGGQKQRVSIARALVRKPKILILDDSYSALDFATEYRLRSAVGGLDYNPVKIIISQRSSTVMHADKIVVLDDGHVTGIGNHEDLLKYNETYREIYNSQINADAPLDEEEGGGSGD